MTGFAHAQHIAKGDRWVCADCGQTVGWLRQAFNYKRLRQERYFQTPEGRAVIEMIYRRYPNDSRVRNWLLKLAQDGGLIVSAQWQNDIDLLAEGERSGDPHLVERANERLDGMRPDIVLWRTDKMTEGQPEPVQPGLVSALGQMLDQGYKGKGVDLMNLSFDEVDALYEDWEQTHKRDPSAGHVVHAFPDGWTMRRLEDKDQVFKEGADMRNCVPQYAPSVEEEKAHIFSLRDELNRPHANVLITPQDAGGHWEGGTVRDIRGKANSTPLDEYADRLSNWFSTFNVKPNWSPNPGPANDPGPGHPGRYGLDGHTASFTEDWFFEAAWQVDSSWNRVRNQLVHNDQFDAEAEGIWGYLKALYGYRVDPETGEVHEDPKNDRLADWLMREVRNDNIQMPYRVITRVDDIADIVAQLEHQGKEARGYEHRLQDGVTPEVESLITESLTEIKRKIKELEELEAHAKAEISDPKVVQEHLIATRAGADSERDPRTRQQYLSRALPHIMLPETKDYQGEMMRAVIDQDWLGSMQDVMKGRKDKAKALRKNPAMYEDQIAETRSQIRQLDKSGPEYQDRLDNLEDKLADYQKRIEDSENSDLNTLDATGIAHEVQQQAWARRLAKDGGKVIHTFPDGKTVRWIDSEEVARLEGEIMGHCMGQQYASRCADGSSVNLSIRDKKGMPHATFEVVPRRNPTIDWDEFFEKVSADPKKYKNLAVKPGGTDRSMSDFRFDFGEIGDDITDEEGELLEGLDGRAIFIGDYVHVQSSPGTEPFSGWVAGIDPANPRHVGIFRNDDTNHGGGPGDSWTTSVDLIQQTDPPVVLSDAYRRQYGVKDDDPTDDEVNINLIRQRARKYMDEEPGATYRNVTLDDPELSKALIEAGVYMPAFEGSDAHQVQGKGNKVPEQRYHKYLRDYFDSFSDEDRPRSVWSSFFSPKPVQYIDHLEDADAGIDELGAKVEGDRGIDWDAVIHSANDGRPQMEGSGDSKYFVPINSTELTYDENKGQKMLGSALERGHARSIFKSLIDLEKRKKKAQSDDAHNFSDFGTDAIRSPEDLQGVLTGLFYDSDNEDRYNYTEKFEGRGGYRTSDHPAEVPGYRADGRNFGNRSFAWAHCPNCQEDAWLQDDGDGEFIHWHCPNARDESRYIQAEFVSSAHSPIPERPPTPEKRGPLPRQGLQYTPYEAAMVQHLGPQLEEHFRTQSNPADYQWALHGAPETAVFKCTNCGSSELRLCNQCQPADHYICNNCGAMIPMPRQQIQPQAQISEGIKGCPYNHGRRKRIHVSPSGNLCACLYHSSAQIENQGMVKQADKMNDFLMNPTSRPDLQTPEAQQFLNTLRDNYLTPKTDQLMPWLAREWKNGLIQHGSEQDLNVPHIPGHLGTKRITPDLLQHWADWYHSDHPTRQGQDIMQIQAPDMFGKIDEWEKAMRADAGGSAIHRGKIDHEWPDKWSVQRLEGQQPMKEEGELLAHCIGGYHKRVRDGDHIVYSLRDQENVPQCSWAIVADRNNDYCPTCEDRQGTTDESGDCFRCGNPLVKVPHGGTMEQIQAMQNSAPTPDMQKRIKDWTKAKFHDGSNGTEDDRPTWGDQSLSYASDFIEDGYTEYHPGDYGLEEPETEIDPMLWTNCIEEISQWGRAAGNEDFDRMLVAIQALMISKAVELGQVRELERAADRWYEDKDDEARADFEKQWRNDPDGMAESYGRSGKFENTCEECGGDGDEDQDNCEKCDGTGEAGDSAKEEYYDDIQEEAFADYWDTEYTDDRVFYDDISNAILGAQHNQMLRSASIKCHTCGDLTENGVCPRCDWGGTGAEWPEVTPLPSVKRDIADGFQASAPYDWALN